MSKKRTGKHRGILAAVLGVSIALFLGAVIFLSGNKGGRPVSDGQIGVDGDLVFSTDYIDLHLPAQWKDEVWAEYVESDIGGVYIFYGKAGGKQTELFAVLFSKSQQTATAPVGVIDVNGEPILVSVKMNDIKADSSWSEKERNEIESIREDINYLIEKLHSQPGFSEDMELLADDLWVETPFATLGYPGIWKDWIWTEFSMSDHSGSVTFYGMVSGTDVPLFTVYFGGGTPEAVSVGYVMKDKIAVPVSVQMYPVPENEDWTEEDISNIAAMQEGVNDLLDHLKKTSVFSSNGIAAAEPAEDVIVTTPYLDLHFPGQWAEFLSTTQTHEEGYAVSYYATLEGKEAELFTVCFDMEGDNSVPIGMIQQGDHTVTVAVRVEELAVDETWTTSEINIASAMQECVNDVINQLSATEGFALL